MKHILILISLLILTLPLVAQETGVLYFKEVNGKYGWFENGDDKKDWKYIGEIINGKPNGTGVLSSTFGKYSGEVKNGMKHGQGTYTYKSGRKRVGEFRKSKPWNVKNYDKNGKIEHDIDADFSALMGKLQVTDGVKDGDIQVLLNKYVIKIWLKPICLFFARDKVNDRRKD